MKINYFRIYHMKQILCRKNLPAEDRLATEATTGQAI